MEKFIQLFEEQLDALEPLQLTADTRFRELEDWSSLIALSVIAMIDEEYGVSVSGEEFRKAQTIGDLFALCK